MKRRLSFMFSNLSEGEKGYIAGVLDSDGCIFIHCYSIPEYPEKDYFSLRLSVANTCFEFVRWFEELLGGHIYKREMTKKNPNWSDSWQWLLMDNRQVLALLSEVTQYLVRKKEIAELVLQFPLEYTRYNGRPKAIVDKQRELFEAVRELNAKGPKSDDDSE